MSTPADWRDKMRRHIASAFAPPFTPPKMRRRFGHRHARASLRQLRQETKAIVASRDPAIVAARARVERQLAGHSPAMITLNTLHRLALAQRGAAAAGVDVATMIDRLVDEWTDHPDRQPIIGI
jgi:hypothetical protein